MTSSGPHVEAPVDWRDRLTFAFLQEPPFCFRDPEGRVRGCDVELAQAVNRAIGGGTFAPIEAVFSGLLPGLVARRWVMTTGLFVTAERAMSVDFSRPIWALPDGLLVSASDATRITGYRALARDETTRLGIISDQVQHRTAIRLGVPEARIEPFSTQEEAAEAVAGGRITAYASVAMAHRGYLAARPNARLAVIEVPDAEQPPAVGAFAFAKDNLGLKAAVDAALDAYLGSAEHRAIMARHGFSQTDIDRIVNR